jgi:hypothetical protein
MMDCFLRLGDCGGEMFTEIRFSFLPQEVTKKLILIIVKNTSAESRVFFTDCTKKSTLRWGFWELGAFFIGGKNLERLTDF